MAFTVSMNVQRIITMNAKICDDAKGTNFLDSGTTEIAVAKIPSNNLNPPPV